MPTSTTPAPGPDTPDDDRRRCSADHDALGPIARRYCQHAACAHSMLAAGDPADANRHVGYAHAHTEQACHHSVSSRRRNLTLLAGRKPVDDAPMDTDSVGRRRAFAPGGMSVLIHIGALCRTGQASGYVGRKVSARNYTGRFMQAGRSRYAPLVRLEPTGDGAARPHPEGR